jgi:hypothetical protein
LIHTLQTGIVRIQIANGNAKDAGERCKVFNKLFDGVFGSAVREVLGPVDGDVALVAGFVPTVNATFEGMMMRGFVFIPHSGPARLILVR